MKSLNSIVAEAWLCSQIKNNQFDDCCCGWYLLKGSEWAGLIALPKADNNEIFICNAPTLEEIMKAIKEACSCESTQDGFNFYAEDSCESDYEFLGKDKNYATVALLCWFSLNNIYIKDLSKNSSFKSLCYVCNERNKNS